MNPRGGDVGCDDDVSSQTDDAGVPLGRGRDNADAEIRRREHAQFDIAKDASESGRHRLD
ncbi:hypothetical protein GCM10029976_094420 [Kribbella albertanoniae]